MNLLSVWAEAGQAEARFWQQTPASFDAVMRGVTRRLEREGEAALTACWQTGAFTGQAMAGKLKKLAHYRRKTNTGPAIASNSEILARFGAMAERGLDVAVT